ncbi:hypothetical protein FB451DRAFT_1562362 [Mycena latifolia]|nr:hypothetical protein FB451DRAFT_1562362 [Mycena latifolia]
MNINGDGFYGTTSLVPVVDGQFIAQRPTLALAQGKKALLSVTNAFEGTIFVNQSTANATQYALDLYPNFGHAQADRVGLLYSALGSSGATPCTESVWQSSSSSHGRFYDVVYLLAISLDPNIQVDSTTITPPWRKWSFGQTEMLFNKTDADVPDVRPVRTSDALLERCAFWNSTCPSCGPPAAFLSILLVVIRATLDDIPSVRVATPRASPALCTASTSLPSAARPPRPPVAAARYLLPRYCAPRHLPHPCPTTGSAPFHACASVLVARRQFLVARTATFGGGCCLLRSRARARDGAKDCWAYELQLQTLNAARSASSSPRLIRRLQPLPAPRRHSQYQYELAVPNSGARRRGGAACLLRFALIQELFTDSFGPASTTSAATSPRSPSSRQQRAAHVLDLRTNPAIRSLQPLSTTARVTCASMLGGTPPPSPHACSPNLTPSLAFDSNSRIPRFKCLADVYALAPHRPYSAEGRLHLVLRALLRPSSSPRDPSRPCPSRRLPGYRRAVRPIFHSHVPSSGSYMKSGSSWCAPTSFGEQSGSTKLYHIRYLRPALPVRFVSHTGSSSSQRATSGGGDPGCTCVGCAPARTLRVGIVLRNHGSSGDVHRASSLSGVESPYRETRTTLCVIPIPKIETPPPWGLRAHRLRALAAVAPIATGARVQELPLHYERALPPPQRLSPRHLHPGSRSSSKSESLVVRLASDRSISPTASSGAGGLQAPRPLQKHVVQPPRAHAPRHEQLRRSPVEERVAHRKRCPRVCPGRAPRFREARSRRSRERSECGARGCDIGAERRGAASATAVGGGCCPCRAGERAREVPRRLTRFRLGGLDILHYTARRLQISGSNSAARADAPVLGVGLALRRASRCTQRSSALSDYTHLSSVFRRPPCGYLWLSFRRHIVLSTNIPALIDKRSRGAKHTRTSGSRQWPWVTRGSAGVSLVAPRLLQQPCTVVLGYRLWALIWALIESRQRGLRTLLKAKGMNSTWDRLGNILAAILQRVKKKVMTKENARDRLIKTTPTPDAQGHKRKLVKAKTYLPFVESEALPYTTPEQHYHIASSRNFSMHLSWLGEHRDDPATADFLPKLQEHLLSRLSHPDWSGDGHEFTTAERFKLVLKNNRVYRHKILRINYTGYDVRRGQDSLNPHSHSDVMYLAPEGDTTHPFAYAQVVGVFHADVVNTTAGADPAPQAMDFLWVRRYRLDPRWRAGFNKKRLYRLEFLPNSDEDAFGFLNPDEVIRGAHIIPAFAHRRTEEFLVPGSIGRLPRDGLSDSEDWRYYYVNFFVDCDMYMRYVGGGVGHYHVDIPPEEDAQGANSEDEPDLPEPEVPDIPRTPPVTPPRTPELDETALSDDRSDSGDSGSSNGAESGADSDSDTEGEGKGDDDGHDDSDLGPEDGDGFVEDEIDEGYAPLRRSPSSLSAPLRPFQATRRRPFTVLAVVPAPRFMQLTPSVCGDGAREADPLERGRARRSYGTLNRTRSSARGATLKRSDEAAPMIALDESSAHPEYHPDRLACALTFLDEVLGALELTAVDACALDVYRYAGRAAPVVNVRPGVECACLLPGGPLHDLDTVGSSVLPWNARVVRAEEVQRRCWGARTGDGNVGTGKCGCPSPSLYLLLFPNEMYDRGRGGRPGGAREDRYLCALLPEHAPRAPLRQHRWACGAQEAWHEMQAL